MSHPFIERLIGTVRREFTDQTPFWNTSDLEKKLNGFTVYYNSARVHHSLGGATPQSQSGKSSRKPVRLDDYRWQSHCRGLYKLPAAA
jgi:transposase InsO family protein